MINVRWLKMSPKTKHKACNTPECLLLLLLVYVVVVTSSISTSPSSSAGNNNNEDTCSSSCCCSWGTYRPHLYVGLQQRQQSCCCSSSSSSPLVGVMWYKPSLSSSKSNPDNIIRHECNYYDYLTAYGWNRHNGYNYAKQRIDDPNLNARLTFTWIELEQHPSTNSSSSSSLRRRCSGDDDDKEKSYTTSSKWVLRIVGEPLEQEKEVEKEQQHDLSLLWYIATPGEVMKSTYNSSSQRIVSASGGNNNRNRNNTYSDYYEMWWKEPSNKTNKRNSNKKMNRHPTYYYQTTNNMKTGITYNSTYFAALQVDPSTYYNPKPYVAKELFANPPNTYQQQSCGSTSSLPLHLSDSDNPSSSYRAMTPHTGNVIVNQVFWTLPFQMDLHYYYSMISSSSSSSLHANCSANCRRSSVKNGGGEKHEDEEDNDYDADAITDAIAKSEKDFKQRFHETFVAVTTEGGSNKEKKPLLPSSTMENNATTEAYRSSRRVLPQHHQQKQHVDNGNNSWKNDELETAYYALSNMLGSITYMYGNRQIYIPHNDSIVSIPVRRRIMAIVPDRPNHAQGYLWDEGFQQHLISLWDLELSLNILQSWWDTCEDYDKYGESSNSSSSSSNCKTTEKGCCWIPRQQIIGDEVRWSAQPTSWPQFVGTANPPSHFLVLDTLLTRKEQQQNWNESQTQLLTTFLSKNYDKFVQNFNWYRYSQVSNLGPDLFHWVGCTTGYCLPSGMDDYPRAPIITADAKEAHLDLQAWMILMARTLAKIAAHLGKLNDTAFYNGLCQQYTTALIDHFWDDKRQMLDDFYFSGDDNIKHFNSHNGYLNYYPIFLNVLNTTSHHFDVLIRKLLDPATNSMWTKYGVLRSLSSKDKYYRHGDNYWTGPVWLNMHYMLLMTMHRIIHYEPDLFNLELRHKIADSYKNLRQNFVRMVVDNYSKTNFIWEVYDDDDTNVNNGKGYKNHPFTGWSALIVNIMAELY